MRIGTGQQAAVSTHFTLAKHGRRARRQWAVIAAAAGVLGVMPAARADSNWIGTTGDYNTPTNWDNGVPNGANGFVDNGGTVQLVNGDAPATPVDLRAGNTSTGTGTYMQTGSTATLSGSLLLGHGGPAASGTYLLSGGQLTITNGKLLDGEVGTGLFNMSGGLLSVNGGPTAVGANTGATGTFNLTGGTMTSTGEVWSGNAGSGSININSGGTLNLSNWLAVGRNGGVGVVNLGPGGVITKTGNGNITFAGVTNTLNQTGGTLTNTASETWIGEGGTSFYNMSGGTADLSEFELGRNGNTTGTLNLSGGTLGTAETGGNMAIANTGGATGLVNMTGGILNVGTPTNAGQLWVGQLGTGTMNVSAGTVNAYSWLAVARSGGSVGVLNISGTAVVNKVNGNGNFTIAGNGGTETGTVNQTNGTVTNTASETWVGESGNGFYNLSGGTANLSNLILGLDGGSTGTVNLSGTGTLNAAQTGGAVLVANAANSTGTLNVSAGTLTVGSATNSGLLSVGQSGAGTLNLTGGAITATNVYATRSGSGTGVINASAGTLTASTISLGAQDVGSSGTPSGTLNVSGTAVVNATSLYVGKSGGGTNGTFTMTGGTLNVAQLARGTASGTVVANLNGGTINNATGADNPNFISGFNAGELNLNGVTINTAGNTLSVNSPFSGTGGYTKVGGGTLLFTAPGGTSTGTANITAGTVRLAAPSAVIPTASVAAFYPMTSIQPGSGFTPNGLVPDSSPNGNDLTPGGGTITATTMAPPGAGHAGSLSFSNGGFLSYAYGGFPTNVPTGNAAYTLGAWINLSTANNNGSSGSTGNNGIDGIVGYGSFGGPASTINTLRTGYYGGPNGITNEWGADDGSGPVPNGGTLAGNWHYVAATYDPTAGGVTGGLGVRSIYIDGQLVDTEDPNAIHNTGATNFNVGVTNLLANPPAYFSGNMADLIIGTTAFTPAQLAVAAASDNPFAANTSGGNLSSTSAVNIASAGTLDLNGQNQTLAGVSGTGAITLGAGTLTINNTVATEFDGTISGSGGFTKTGTGTFTLGGNGSNLTYTGMTTVNAGTLTFGANTGTTPLVRNLTGGVTINGGTLALPSSNASGGRTLLVTPSLTFATTGTPAVFAGKLDLANGDLDVKNASAAAAATTLASVTAAAASGYAGGTLTGTGLTSAAAAADTRHLTAVGVIQNVGTNGTTPIYTTFDGQSVSATDVLARYTYYGDTNLDGVVNGADYSRIDAGFVGHLTGWANGDFNYDGAVDGSDYTLADNAFNQQTGAVAAPASALAGGVIASATAELAGNLVASPDGAAAVPEPTTLGVLAVGAVGLLGRRRRAGR